MDFHAYCEVYLGNEWLTFDPRFNVQRIGRVKVAHGADAVDGAFTTIYGEANLAGSPGVSNSIPSKFLWGIRLIWPNDWTAQRPCGCE